MDNPETPTTIKVRENRRVNQDVDNPETPTKIKVRENRRVNQEWTTQRHRHKYKLEKIEGSAKNGQPRDTDKNKS